MRVRGCIIPAPYGRSGSRFAPERQRSFDELGWLNKVFRALFRHEKGEDAGASSPFRVNGGWPQEAGGGGGGFPLRGAGVSAELLMTLPPLSVGAATD